MSGDEFESESSKDQAERETEQIMSSEKMTYVMDSLPIRVTLNVIAWAVWMAVTFGVLELAAKS